MTISFLSPDQVSILVRQASNVNAKPVLLNVPRKVAIKVKKGTTLSFSASNDQKYVVVDNKIHPPLRNEGSGGGSRHLPQQPRAQQNSYNSSQRPIHRPTNFQGNNRMASSTSSPTSIAASYQVRTLTQIFICPNGLATLESMINANTKQNFLSCP